MPALTNAKHEAFALEFTIDRCGTKAAIRAGYSPRSAGSQAHDLLKKPEILARISELTAERFERLKMSGDEIIARLSMIARADIRDVVDANGCLRPIHTLSQQTSLAIASIDVICDKADDEVPIQVVRIRLRDPIAALRILADYHRLLVDEERADSLLTNLAERMEAARRRVRSAQRQAEQEAPATGPP